jgi:hypothetical protein
MTLQFDPQRLVAALMLAATALFLLAVAPGFRYRRAARIAAIAVFAVVFTGVVVWVVLWLAGAAAG